MEEMKGNVMTGMYGDCGDYTLSVARRVVLAKKSSDLGSNAVEQESSLVHGMCTNCRK